MTTTLLIENLVANVLFDFRVMHSFVSKSLADKMDKPKQDLEQRLIVNTPLRRMLPTSDRVKECEIRIGESITKIDLRVLEMEDYNVILGIY